MGVHGAQHTLQGQLVNQERKKFALHLKLQQVRSNQWMKVSALAANKIRWRQDDD